MFARIRSYSCRALAIAAVVIAGLAVAGPGVADAAGATFFVARGGSDAVACTANSATAPFASIQRALGCAGDGDVISLAPSGAKPYPGIGTVAANVTIKAAAAANARTVSIDAGQGPLNVSPGANAILTGVTLNCITNCGGSPTITDRGQLLLSADTVTGNNSLPSSAILTTTPDNSATSAQLTIQNSTISGNASKTGGAIQTNSGAGATGASTLNIANSTIADNVALSQGGGITAVASAPGSSATITNSTITGNTASSAGGLYASSPVMLTNTIIAANKVRGGATDCQSGSGGSTITDGPGGHNLIGNPTGCGAITPGTNNDLVGSSTNPLDPQLGPLAYSGGATKSEPPLAGSPVIGAGSAAGCLQQPVFNVDQRLQARDAAARDVCDIGADDTGGATPASTPPVITAPASINATVSSPLSLTVKATGSPTPDLSESGALPPGVGFSDQGTGAALLTGTPAPGTAGSYPITITATNGSGSPATRSVALNVATLTVSGITPATIGPGASAIPVTVTGTGFRPGAEIAGSDPGISFSSVVVKNPRTIAARASASQAVQAGAYDLTVTEPGTAATCTGCLTVNGALP